MTTERMIRGMNIEERCSPEESMSHAADASSSWADTGFRLVHDGLFTRQIVRGSSRLNFDRDAGKPICDWNTGCNRFSSVGFRLVREEKES